MRKSLQRIALLVAVAVIGLASRSQAQDVNIPTTSAYLTLARGNSWGSGGACGSGAGCGVNNSYVWSPPTPDSTVCVSITNNNPTNSHSLTLALNQTLDATVQTFSTNPGPWSAVPIAGIAFPQTVGASSTVNFFFRSSSAAKLALVVSGTSALGGVPDTANITIVQPSTASFCGSSINPTSISAVIGATGQGNLIAASNRSPVVIGGYQSVSGVVNVGSPTAQTAAVDSTTFGLIVGTATSVVDGSSSYTSTAINASNGNTVSIMPVLQFGEGNNTGGTPTVIEPRISGKYGVVSSSAWAYDSTTGANISPNQFSAYFLENDSVNPGAGAELIGVNVVTPAVSPNRAFLSCSAACDMIINATSTTGSTCTSVTPQKSYDNGLGSAAVSTATKACGTPPTVQKALQHIWLAAGGTQVIDLQGYYQAGTGQGGTAGFGFDIVEGTALTGTASVTLEFGER